MMKKIFTHEVSDNGIKCWLANNTWGTEWGEEVTCWPPRLTNLEEKLVFPFQFGQ